MRVLILIVSIHLVNCDNNLTTTGTRFYPYGRSTNDSTLFKNDDSFSDRIPISISFPFFNKSYDSLFVSTNGIISFDAGVRKYTPGDKAINTLQPTFLSLAKKVQT
jgi:hypothetical protein